MDMQIVLAIGFVLIVIGVGAYIWKGKTKSGKLTDVAKLGSFLGVVGIVCVAAVVMVGPASLTGAGNVDTTSGGVDGPGLGADNTGEVKVIGSLGVQTSTMWAGATDVVAATVGYFRCLADGSSCDNPSAANVNPVDTTAITSGVGTDTSKYVKTNVPYRILLYETSGTYYDMEFGGNAEADYLPCPSSDESAPTISIEFNDVITVATIGDMLDETATSGIINGQVTSNGTDGCGLEIQVGTDSSPAADDTLYYNETDGDGTFTIKFTITTSGINSGLKNPVLDFVHDNTNPPEGDEYSQVMLTHDSGINFNLPNDVTDNWKNQIPLYLSAENVMRSGQTGVYLLTFSVDESNLDANDVWFLGFDDLGDFNGKDIKNHGKATADVITFDAE